MTILDDIKTEAYRLGFELCSSIAPQAPVHYPVFERWLAAGHHAGMKYLESEYSRKTRYDPRHFFPACRHIISITIPYPYTPTNSDPLKGNIASYALAQDYHLFIPQALEKLRVLIERITGEPITSKACSDSAPILEHDLAWQAGLGWVGKNTCLISKQYGSFHLLAELLIDYELPDTSGMEADHCGNCTRCISACPTGCILPDRTIDASRCLSYHTIENKGLIPESLRPHLSNQIFGCDICQSVCPWNQKRHVERNYKLFPARPELAYPDLIPELSLNLTGFEQKFFETPILRAKRRGYLRNICLALGNSHAVEAISPLANLLNSEPDVLIRAHSAWALGQINHPNSRIYLSTAQKNEMDVTVLHEIQNALDGKIC